MSKKANIIFLILFLSLFLLVFSGCQKQQTARDFYIDAVMLNELNQKDNATEKLNAAVKINPKYSIAYSMLGDIYLEKKEYEKSAAAYETATKLFPWSFDDFFNLGKNYQVMGLFDKAIPAYTRACQLGNSSLQANYNNAQCLYQLADYDNALKYGLAAEQIDSNSPGIQKLLAGATSRNKISNRPFDIIKKFSQLTLPASML